MKRMMINVKKEDSKQKKVVNLLNAKFASDWFQCLRCGDTVQMRAYGNHPRCSKCGGMMERI